MIDAIVTNWLNDSQDALADNYNKLGLRASGNWPNELETYSNITPTKITAGIKGAAYTGALTEGRNPNMNQDPEAIKRWVGWAGNTIIKKWCEDKGVNISPFAVAYKIAREGWRVPNRFNPGGLVDDVFTDGRIKLLTDQIFTGIVSDLKSDVMKAK